jgi:glycerophosphoryl diester phosphodiesterase
MTLFLSHRGESDDAPENTLSAFALAMERDSDGIELDIRLTSDGYAVVVHDADLKRVAQSDAVISETPLEKLQSIHPVPLLKDVLALLKPGKHLQIELKGSDLGIVPELKRILDAWSGDRKQLAISSFEEETIKEAGKYFTDLPRVLLTDLKKKFGAFPTAAETAEYMRSLNCTGVSFKADFAADRSFVEALKAENMRVVCWGVFSDELGLAMAEAGVDAMTCNHAVALRRMYREI